MNDGRQGFSIPYNPGGFGRNLRDVWTFPTQSNDYEFCAKCKTLYSLSIYRKLKIIEIDGTEQRICKCGSHNRWVQHFATFPEELPKRCILAGTSEKGCCPECGAQWMRVIEKTGHINKREPAHVPGNTQTKVDSTGWGPTTMATNKWQPSCDCKKKYSHYATCDKQNCQKYHRLECGSAEDGICWPTKPPDPIPCTVLDPFSGSGTAGLVSVKYGRNYIGIELNPEYVEMSRKRIDRVARQCLLGI